MSRWWQRQKKHQEATGEKVEFRSEARENGSTDVLAVGGCTRHAPVENFRHSKENIGRDSF